MTKLKYGRTGAVGKRLTLSWKKGEKVSIYLVQRGEYLHQSGQILNLNQKSGFDYWFVTIPLFQENDNGKAIFVYSLILYL
ncbi:MAG: hypothetical protein R2821_07085 [Flavobacteriaceae bacterium]